MHPHYNHHGHAYLTAGPWTTGLCGCCRDKGNCCLTWCCPCVVFGRNAEILDRGNTSCHSSCCICGLLSMMGCGPCYAYAYRTKLRGVFSLQEEPCGDCCVHCCCEHCALCQEYRELKNRGYDPSIGWHAVQEKYLTIPPPVVTVVRR